MLSTLLLAVSGQVTVQPSCNAIKALYQSANADGSSCCDGAIHTNEITCDVMQSTPSTHLRKPTGPYGVDSFYIGAEYTQVRVPRRFKVSDVSDQLSAMSFDTPPETVDVNGTMYYGRAVEGVPVYLSPPVPMWAKVTVPSTRPLSDYSIFQDVKSPWLGDSVDEALFGFGGRMPFATDTKIAAAFRAMDLATLWPNANDDTTYATLASLQANTEATPDVIASELRAAIRAASAPPTFRLAAYDVLMASSTVENYQKGDNTMGWSKKYSYLTPAAPPPPPPVLPPGCANVLFTLTPGSYPSEVSVVFDNVTYTPPQDNTVLCLTPGASYDYQLLDSYGDGWNGARMEMAFEINEQVLLSTTLAEGASASGTLTIPTALREAGVRTKLLDADYDLTHVQTAASANGKVPIVFTAFAPENQLVQAEELASWGIASVAHETIYDGTEFRSTTHAHVSMREAMSDPAMGANLYPYVLKNWSPSDNFYLVASDDGSDMSPWWNNVLWSMPWNYNSDMSTTGTDSNDLSVDFFEQTMGLLNTARDRNGVRLSTKLDLNNLGIHAWSGGGHILDGADKLKDARVKASTSWDMVFAMNYGPSGYYGASEGFEQERIRNFGPTQLRFGTDGFSHPHMFLEPEFDSYTPRDTMKTAVGNRLNIQQTLRRTTTAIRSECIFVEWPRLGHAGHGQRTIMSQLYENKVEHPEPRSLLPTNDPVFGIRDDALVQADLQYKYHLLLTLWYRHFLQGTVSLESLHTLGLRLDQGPFDIAGAHDYDWSYRTPRWENDWGPNFKVYTDGGKLYIKDELNDETIDVMAMYGMVQSMKERLDNITAS